MSRSPSDSGSSRSEKPASRSTTAAAPKTTADSPAAAQPDAPELPQEFKLSKVAYFTVPAALLVTFLLAGANLTWLGWTLVLPIILAIWIARLKTVVTEDGMRAVGTFGSREISWPEIDGLQFTRWGPPRAVLVDGGRVRLPAVTFQDMPRLSAASRGRIPDPFAAATSAAQ